MKSQSYKNSEAGIFLPFLALILITLLALVGLVLDAGILFIRKNDLQVIADLGSQAGLGYRTLKGWAYFHNNNFNELAVNGAKDHEIRDRAIEVITQNVLARGLDINQVNVAVTFGGTNLDYGTFQDRILIDLSMNVPLAIMGHVPGLSDCNGNGCNVRISSVAQLQPANILLDIDVSGSMNCPDNDTNNPPCQCRTDPINPRCSAIAASELKINKIKDNNGPLMNFVRFFNPNRDRIGIIPFHTTANVALSILGPTGSIQEIGAKIPQLQNTIANLSPGGNTNSSDALWRSYLNINSANPPVVSNEPFFVLLFSDGADTAGRFSYDRTNAVGTTLDDKITLLNKNDWTNYKVEWTAANGDNWHGPSPLINTSDISSTFAGGEPDPNWTMCGRRQAMESDTSRLNLEFREGPDTDPTKDCLKSFGFYGGFKTTRSVGHTPSQLDQASDFFGANSSYFYLQQYSHASLEIGDYLREQGGIVYAIGLGPKAPVEINNLLNNDPHQNILRDFEQKTFFFERLTADVYHGQTLPVIRYGTAHPSFEQRNIVINDPQDSRNGQTISTGYAGHRDWNWVEQNISKEDRGEYLHANNVDQLTSRFSRVAKQILLRLIQ